MAKVVHRIIDWLSQASIRGSRRIHMVPDPANIPAYMAAIDRVERGEGRATTDLPLLAELLHSRERFDRAEHAIEVLLPRISPLELARLDPIIRHLAYWNSPVTADAVRLVAPSKVGVLGLWSFHRNGHVREAAVRMLAALDDGRELPFLLIRLSDWVPPVSEAAASAVQERVRPDYANHFARCLALVARLDGQKRAEHTPVLKELHAMLRSEVGRNAMRSALTSGDREVGRIAFAFLTAEPHDDLESVLDAALASGDTVLRLRAAKKLRTIHEGPALVWALDRLSQDRLMQVRREALYGFIEQVPESAADRLNVALLDSHVSMREVARFYLRERGIDDFRCFYIERLRSEKGVGLATAVAGVGETGIAADVTTVLPFLDHPQAPVRVTAVRAVARLAADNQHGQLMRKLNDVSASVARTARDVLAARPSMLSAAPLWSIYEQAQTPHTRRFVVALLARCSWWDAAWRLMRAAASDDEALATTAAEFLEIRRFSIGRMTVRPTAEQLDMLGHALSAHRTVLDPRVVTDAEAHLAEGRRMLS